ncbi:MAG: hypothetical protein EOP56_06125 [Sphingobacteriales bacterium]|nr:MAG: hypothetical protein EOP56_06125 [Sphingobacteriales bacterium]
MKKTLIVAFFASLLFSACSKSDNNSNDPNNNGNNVNPVDTAMNYIINGLGDVVMESTDTSYMTLTVSLEKGIQQKVALTVSGLPENAHANLSTQTGIPTFTSLLTLEAKNVKPGSYPIKVTGTSATGTEKSYDLNLKINEKPLDPAFACIKDLEGDYQGSYNGKTYAINITRNTDRQTIIIKNFPEPGVEIKASVNCNDKTIGVIASTYQNYNFNGTGGGSFINPKNIPLTFLYSKDGKQPEYVELTLKR